MRETESFDQKLKKIFDKSIFPIAKMNDIIELSDPPYFTPCPNPFLKNIFNEDYSDDYDVKPYTFDVSEGKNDPIYYAHTYHTKVPFKAIMRYLLHYTKPGDIIFDGFSGSGMTGVAVQLCNTADEELRKELVDDYEEYVWGNRKAILSDLSPIASLLSYVYNLDYDADEFENIAKTIINNLRSNLGWLYNTKHVVSKSKLITEFTDNSDVEKFGIIDYVILSSVYNCKNCSHELVYWEVAIQNNKVKKEFKCPNCNTKQSKADLEITTENIFDQSLNKVIKRTKREPVLIKYEYNGKKFTKRPDAYDYELNKKIEDFKINKWFPNFEMMFKGENWGDTWRKGVHTGITHTHHFFSKRNLIVLTNLYDQIKNLKNPLPLLFLFTSILQKTASLMHNVGFKNSGINLAGQMPNTLYISSIIAERNLFSLLERKIKSIKNAFLFNKDKESVYVQCCPNQNLITIPDNSIDYIFTDPPFGGNLIYSELNFLWESWLKIFTNTELEAILSRKENKKIHDYQNLMEGAFKENYRILKPGRWMTVVFHNSQNSVWIAIQEALMKSGFIIADVRTLDKKQGTKNQMTSLLSVKQDLVITAYKSKGQFLSKLNFSNMNIDILWDFIDQHLEKLPIFVVEKEKGYIIPERQKYLLFDRMVAFYVQRGIQVPISAGDFYCELHLKYPERNGMFFLPTQVNEYERKKLKFSEIKQMTLLITDEKSGIQWLCEEMKDNPQSYQDIQPKFLQNLVHLNKYEMLPELLYLLKENFLMDKKGKWNVPDPNKQADLEKMREKSLLKEFSIYVSLKGKLKQFRIEAVRAGFKQAWSEQDYELIVKIGNRLPSTILQEDDSLLMYYDNASIRL